MRADRTYGFVAAKFDEGVKKRTNPGETEGHSDVLWISGDKNFDMTLEGLDDGQHHFLKARIQEIRLLLETVYLHKGGTGTRSEPNPPQPVYGHSLSAPCSAVAALLISSPHRMDPGSGRVKEGNEDSQGTIRASQIL